MDSKLDEESLQRIQVVSTFTRKCVDEEALAGDDHTLLETIATAINATSFRCTMSDLPFYTFEIDLHDLWYIFIQAAKNFSFDNSKQDSLVRYMLGIREMGTMTRTTPTDDSSEVKTQIVHVSDGNLWSDLPFFVQDIQTEWKRSQDMSVSHRKNLAAFIARLASVGISNDALAGCVLWTFRDTLETPRRVTGLESGSEATIADLLPAVYAFLLFAMDKMVALSNVSFNSIDPKLSELGKLAQDAQVASGGFSPARWSFWKQRLTTISKCDQKEVAEDAVRCLTIMEYSVKLTNGPLKDMA